MFSCRIAFHILVLIVVSNVLVCQKQDYTWILGYSSSRQNTEPTVGTTIVRFANEQLHMTRDTIEANLNATSSLISDPKTGELILYSDGCRVWDHRHKRVKGLEEINRDSYFWGSYYGTNLAQNIIILPDPTSEHIYRLIYLWFDQIKGDTVFRANKLRSSLVNMKDPVNPIVLHKDLDIHYESYSAIGITACRHANGRDWWIVVPTRHSHDKVVFLLDPEGLKFSNKYISGLKSRTMGYGNAAFSPDGNTYGWLSEDDRALDGGFIELFDFDRCEGKLSNHRLKQLNDNNGLWGIAFSSNLKFLYYSGGNYLFREIVTEFSDPDKRILIDSPDAIPGKQFQCTFGRLIQAPDGRFYLFVISTTRCVSVIDYPDAQNIEDIGWRRDGLTLLTINGKTFPNFPNYRLGPLDGSICDTLGFNNIPFARFRQDQDTSRHRCIKFLDLSAFIPPESEPEWYWDLGDGTQSRDTSPIHCFEKDGVYEVCMIIKNKYGADTLCRTLNVGTSVTNDEGKIKLEIDIFPNPASDHFILNVHDYLPESMYMDLINAQGHTVLHERIYQGSNVIDTEKLLTGIYLVNIFERGLLVKSEKIVVRD
ncbi:MAG: T9SS type A sorting domain-containing protein [Saprospiraceae bacterium]|nr:T9SS type A sorting domain-containing protein [Saprospiraceae bacterium]